MPERNLHFATKLILLSPDVVVDVSDFAYIGCGTRDAGREREQRSRPPGQAEKEVAQPVHPQDQQHRAGTLRLAERHAGGTGGDSFINISESVVTACHHQPAVLLQLF